MAQDIVVTFHELVAEAQPLTQGGVQPQVNLSILHLFNLIKDNELYKIKYPVFNAPILVESSSIIYLVLAVKSNL